MDKIFGVIDEALEKAVYKILEGDCSEIYFRDSSTGIDYVLKLEELS